MLHVDKHFLFDSLLRSERADAGSAVMQRPEAHEQRE